MTTSPEPAPPSPARGAVLVSLGILASRLMGLVRQRAIGHFLGTSDQADALAAAFRVGNVLQNLVGEGTLSATLVPLYARARRESASRAADFARTALGWLALIVVTLSALGASFAPTLAAVLAPGFEGDKAALTAALVRILFPMTGVLVLSAWALGILTAHRRFLLPYAAPLLWSTAQIVAVVLAAFSLGHRGDDLARAVAWGALAGAVLQLGVMLPAVRTALGSLAPTLARSELVTQAATRLPGALAGRGILQLSGLVDTLLVSLLGSGAVAIFGFAQTAYLLPMAFLGTGEAAASLPDLAEQAGGGAEAKDKMRAHVQSSLTRVLTLALGASAFFAVLGPEIVALLFQGGAFDRAATLAVASVLAVYAVGLPANASARVLSTVSFAFGDTRGPARFAFVRVAVSTALSLLFMKRFGTEGVVLGAVLAAWVELALLGRAASDKLGGLGLGRLPWVRMVAASGAVALVALGAQRGLALVILHPLFGALVSLTLAGGAFLGAGQALGLISLRALLRRSKRRPPAAP